MIWTKKAKVNKRRVLQCFSFIFCFSLVRVCEAWQFMQVHNIFYECCQRRLLWKKNSLFLSHHFNAQIHVHWPNPHLMGSENSNKNCQLIEDRVRIKFSKLKTTKSPPAFQFYSNPLLNWLTTKTSSSGGGPKNRKYQISILNWAKIRFTIMFLSFGK